VYQFTTSYQHTLRICLLEKMASSEVASDVTPAPAPREAAIQAVNMQREVDTRRTFAIISHPDAGKTTLTEKLLYYGGAIQEAGAVRARRGAKVGFGSYCSRLGRLLLRTRAEGSHFIGCK
jgi:hypothetical protein